MGAAGIREVQSHLRTSASLIRPAAPLASSSRRIGAGKALRIRVYESSDLAARPEADARDRQETIEKEAARRKRRLGQAARDTAI